MKAAQKLEPDTYLVIGHLLLTAILIVIAYAAIAGWYGKTDAQETGDTIIIGDTVYTAIEITDDDIVWVGGDDE